ncbi:hypothetical protein [Maribacter sp. 2308TA10-17]|uniref:hypothetical protein n=1 Tax=Maribacter sp. 2308TA10-17 TaxID=3386276 RepID=UPI0039BC6A79
MKIRIPNLLLFFFLSTTFGQSNDRTYLGHDHNYSSVYSYGISEITIHSDSTYTRKNWSVNNKKEWKTYKNYKPEISNGKITRNGEFYSMTEYRNGHKTDYSWTIKISEKRLNYYYPNKKEKLRISAKYKRIR